MPVFEEQKTRSLKELRSPKCLLSRHLSSKSLNSICKEPFRFAQKSELPLLNFFIPQSSAFLCIPCCVHLLKAQQCGVSALHQVPVNTCLKLRVCPASDQHVSPDPGNLFLPPSLYACCICPYTKSIPCF